MYHRRDKQHWQEHSSNRLTPGAAAAGWIVRTVGYEGWDAIYARILGCNIRNNDVRILRCNIRKNRSRILRCNIRKNGAILLEYWNNIYRCWGVFTKVMKLIRNNVFQYIFTNAEWLQGVHELRQQTFEPLLKNLAFELWIAI